MDKKIAIIFDLSEPGGVQTCVISLIKGLNNLGITPDLLWDSQPREELIRTNNLKIGYVPIVFRVSSMTIKKLPASFRYLLWPFNVIYSRKIADKYDFVYSFTTLFIEDKKVPHLIYLSGPPLLPQLESKKLHFKCFKELYKIFIKPFFPMYEYFPHMNYFINSEYTANLFKEAHNAKLEVVYPANLLRKAKLEHDFLNRDTITFFSRIVDYKRPHFMFQLAGLFPLMRFLIMGGVSKNRRKYFLKLQEEAHKLKLSNVIFKANVSKDNINLELNRTLIYVFPAINEHFGITTVEAILAGCIPFVHNSGGQKEIVPIEALRFDDSEFIQKFQNLINSSSEILSNYRQTLLENCERFTEEAYIKKMLIYIN